MLSIEQCRKLIDENAPSLTDDEILALRDTFYGLAELALDKKSQEKNNFVSPAGFGRRKDISPPKTSRGNGRCHVREAEE